MMPAMWNIAELVEVEYRRPIHQSSDQTNSGRREIEKPPCSKETEGQESRSRRDHQFNPIEKRSIRGRTPDMRAKFQAGTNKASI